MKDNLKTEEVKTQFGTLYKAYKALNKAGHKISFQAVYQWKENVPKRWADKIKDISK